MIVDRLDNAERYAPLHPGFRAAFEYLKSEAWKPLAAGKHGIDGKRLFVNMVVAPGKSRTGTRLEVHREYIDIQYAVDGTDEIGWEVTQRCAAPDGSFSAEKDIGFFKDAAALWVPVPPGTFAIFFPWDAHAPMGAAVPLRKAVVKVAMQW